MKLINFFPTKGGILDTLSPKTIISGKILDYKKHLSIQIRQYRQVHEEDAPCNIQNLRTKGAISFGLSGNLQGGFEFMALNTGKKNIRRSWDVIPMPYTVITRVKTIFSDKPEQFMFNDRRGRPIGDVKISVVDPYDVDHIEIPGVDASDIDVDNIKIQGVDVDIQEPQVIEIFDPYIPLTNPAPIEPSPVHQVAAAVEPMPSLQQVDPMLRRSSRFRAQTENYTPIMPGYKYSYAVMHLEIQGVMKPDVHMFVQEEFYQAESDIVTSVMTQTSLKSGLIAWGDKVYTDVKSEMKQLSFLDTFKPKYRRELNHPQRQTVMELHMFLREKRHGAIKGRAVAGGEKQRDYISKEDASSPTVATKAVLL